LNNKTPSPCRYLFIELLILNYPLEFKKNYLIYDELYFLLQNVFNRIHMISITHNIQGWVMKVEQATFWKRTTLIFTPSNRLEIAKVHSVVEMKITLIPRNEEDSWLLDRHEMINHTHTYRIFQLTHSRKHKAQCTCINSHIR